MLFSYTLINQFSHLVLNFVLWSFGFVSCFVLRISDFHCDLIYMTQRQTGSWKVSHEPYK
jgi:hypothetical protein